MSLDEIMEAVREFERERDWAQYHDPKNLAMAIASEAGELLAEYRWIDNASSDLHTTTNRDRVSTEIGDIGLTLLMFCDRAGIDLVDSILKKLEANRRNYPVETTRGRADRVRRGVCEAEREADDESGRDCTPGFDSARD